jgi:uncharacterized RDD family membrane protein YckC
MSVQYCAGCGNSLMMTMRMCPSCGGRAFSPTPPLSPAATSSPSIPQSSVFHTGNQKPSAINTNSLAPAGHWPRLIAAVIDAVIVSLLAGVPSGLAIAFAASGSGGWSLVNVVLILVSIIAPYAYFTILHSSPRRATFGKSAMGLVLVTVQGEKLSRVQAFIRILLVALVPLIGILLFTLSITGIATQAKTGLGDSIAIALILGFLVVYLGPFLMVFFNPNRQTLFDVICKTCVVKQ